MDTCLRRPEGSVVYFSLSSSYTAPGETAPSFSCIINKFRCHRGVLSKKQFTTINQHVSHVLIWLEYLKLSGRKDWVALIALIPSIISLIIRVCAFLISSAQGKSVSLTEEIITVRSFSSGEGNTINTEAIKSSLLLNKPILDHVSCGAIMLLSWTLKAELTSRVLNPEEWAVTRWPVTWTLDCV